MSKRIEWSLIRGSIGVFIVCLLLSAVLIYASYIFRSTMNKEYTQHQNHFRNVSSKYLSVDGDEMIIKEHYPHFIELYNRGIIGEEKRLNWVETLESAKKTINLPELRYQIESRKPYEAGLEINTNGYDLFTSNMTLKVGLLHEIDLARLINELNSNASGLFSIKGCQFDRNSASIEFDPTRANINVDCDLQWFSLDLSGDREITL